MGRYTRRLHQWSIKSRSIHGRMDSTEKWWSIGLLPLQQKSAQLNNNWKNLLRSTQVETHLKTAEWLMQPSADVDPQLENPALQISHDILAHNVYGLCPISHDICWLCQGEQKKRLFLTRFLLPLTSLQGLQCSWAFLHHESTITITRTQWSEAPGGSQKVSKM